MSTAKPADLRPGDRIQAGTWTLTVDRDVWLDGGEEMARRLGIDYRPEEDGVLVDVEAPRHRDVDAVTITAAAGATAAQLLALVPLRYRLFFHPDTDVPLA